MTMMNQLIPTAAGIIMIIGVLIVLPITVVGSIYKFFNMIKSEKTDSHNLATSMQTTMLQVMMSLMKQPTNNQNSNFSNMNSNGFNNGFNAGFNNVYDVNDVNDYVEYANMQPNLLGNKRAKLNNSFVQGKNNGFLIGLLTGIIVFLVLFIVFC